MFGDDGTAVDARFFEPRPFALDIPDDRPDGRMRLFELAGDLGLGEEPDIAPCATQALLHWRTSAVGG